MFVCVFSFGGSCAYTLLTTAIGRKVHAQVSLATMSAQMRMQYYRLSRDRREKPLQVLQRARNALNEPQWEMRALVC